MQQIDFSQETIKAIADFIKATEIEGSVTPVFDAEFEQDGYLILVDYEVYAERHEELMVHSELSYNNVEDLSHWEYKGAKVNGISILGDDGEDISFSESEYEAIEKLAA